MAEDTAPDTALIRFVERVVLRLDGKGEARLAEAFLASLDEAIGEQRTHLARRRGSARAAAKQRLARLKELEKQADKLLTAAPRPAGGVGARTDGQGGLGLGSRFLPDLLHQLRNPLFGLSANLDLLDEELAGSRWADAFGSARGELDRIARLLQDLQEFAAPLDPKLAPRKLARSIEAALAEVRLLAQGRGTSLEAFVEEALPSVRVDETLLQRGLVRLLENAVWRTPPSGSVALFAVRSTARAGMVELRIEDGGPALGAEVQAHVLEPFVARGAGRSGLGLAIAERLAVATGASLSVTNRAGCPGVCASLVIPYAPEAS